MFLTVVNEDRCDLKKWVLLGQQQVGMAIRAPDGASKDEDENTGAQKGFQGTWSTYPLATCLTP